VQAVILLVAVVVDHLILEHQVLVVLAVAELEAMALHI
jgi:hypothetical protein